MRAFHGDPSRPGKLVLIVGIGIYAVTALFCVSAGFVRPLLALLFVPIFGPFMVLALAPVAFVIGFVTGTPLVSFSYANRMIGKSIRGVIGSILLFAVFAAFADMALVGR